MKYIAFDLDGTLAFHGEGDDIDTIGAPIPAMVELAKRFLTDGIEVRIITARVAPEYTDNAEQRAMIQAWCLEHLGEVVPVQAHKCGRMERLYDDRAYGVVRNEGQLQTDRYQALGELVGESRIRSYDRTNGIESDAFAKIDEDFGDDPEFCIAVHCCGTEADDDPCLVSPREARCLAASLLRAANKYDQSKGK